MRIYRNPSNYRAIYEQHYGPVPKDHNGRTYDIHHIDGDHTNNDPSNLRAVSIQEHYDIHYQQKDYMACYMIRLRIDKSPEMLSELSRKGQEKRVIDGTHHMLGGHVQRKRVENGTHPWQDKEWHKRREQEKVDNGSHMFLNPEISRAITSKRLADGTHNFLNNTYAKDWWDNKPEDVLAEYRKNAQERQRNKVADGSHHFLNSGEKSREIHRKLIEEGRHPSQVIRTCPHCGKEGRRAVMFKHHFDKCKQQT